MLAQARYTIRVAAFHVTISCRKHRISRPISRDQEAKIIDFWGQAVLKLTLSTHEPSNSGRVRAGRRVLSVFCSKSSIPSKIFASDGRFVGSEPLTWGRGADLHLISRGVTNLRDYRISRFVSRV